jgi:hypothetical protein
MKLFESLEQIRNVYEDDQIVDLVNRACKDISYRQEYMKKRNQEKALKVKAYDEWVRTGKVPEWSK